MYIHPFDTGIINQMGLSIHKSNFEPPFWAVLHTHTNFVIGTRFNDEQSAKDFVYKLDRIAFNLSEQKYWFREEDARSLLKSNEEVRAIIEKHQGFVPNWPEREMTHEEAYSLVKKISDAVHICQVATCNEQSYALTPDGYLVELPFPLMSNYGIDFDD